MTPAIDLDPAACAERDAAEARRLGTPLSECLREPDGDLERDVWDAYAAAGLGSDAASAAVFQWSLRYRAAFELLLGVDEAERAARAAIYDSASSGEIVRLDHTDELEDALGALADDSADTGEELEHWGADDDGDPWRVHLVRGGR